MDQQQEREGSRRRGCEPTYLPRRHQRREQQSRPHVARQPAERRQQNRGPRQVGVDRLQAVAVLPVLAVHVLAAAQAVAGLLQQVPDIDVRVGHDDDRHDPGGRGDRRDEPPAPALVAQQQGRERGDGRDRGEYVDRHDAGAAHVHEAVGRMRHRGDQADGHRYAQHLAVRDPDRPGGRRDGEQQRECQHQCGEPPRRPLSVVGADPESDQRPGRQREHRRPGRGGPTGRLPGRAEKAAGSAAGKVASLQPGHLSITLPRAGTHTSCPSWSTLPARGVKRRPRTASAMAAATCRR